MISGIIRGATCASCNRFPLQSLERAEPGICAIFEQWTEHTFTACVLYEPAVNKEARRVIVMRMAEQK